jgi:hypothetical protein
MEVKKGNTEEDGSPVHSIYVGKKFKNRSRWNKNRFAVI